MKTAQAQKQNCVTSTESLTLVRNLMRTSTSIICYLRNVFPDECFVDKTLAGMDIKSLVPGNDEAKMVIDWLEKGVFDAVSKNYLKSLIFGICSDPSGSVKDMIESYEFGFVYTDSSIVMNIGGKNQSIENKVQTKDEIVNAMQRMIRTLITYTQTLKAIPETRWLTMKLLYYDDIVPEDYEPMFFSPLPPDEKISFGKDFVKIRVGEFSTGYHSIDVKVRTRQDLFAETDYETAREEEIIESVKYASPDEEIIQDSQETQLSDEETELVTISTQVSKMTVDPMVEKREKLYKRAMYFFLTQDYTSPVLVADNLSIPLSEANIIVERGIAEKLIGSIYSKEKKGHRILRNKNSEKIKESVLQSLKFDQNIETPKKNTGSIVDRSPKETSTPGIDTSFDKKRKFDSSVSQDPFDYEGIKVSSISNPIGQKKKKIYRDTENFLV